MHDDPFSLSQYLQRTLIDGHKRPVIISVIGSGGKTSVIERIALLGKRCHLRVLVTTTTHMALPSDHQYPFGVYRADDIENLPLDDEHVMLVGNWSEKRVKPLTIGQFESLRGHFDMILIEADGARGMELKYHRESEPVIRADTDILIKVLGLNALGKKSAQTIHNCFLWRGCEDKIVDEHIVHALAFDPRGLNATSDAPVQMMLYNQSDTLDKSRLGTLIESGLQYFRESRDSIVIGSVKQDAIEYIYRARG